MNSNSEQERRVSPWVWVAGAAGTAAGVASLLYARSRQSRWSRAKRRMIRAAETIRETALESAETVRKNPKPWVGAAAGVTAGSVALAYRLTRKPSPWDQARQVTGQIAKRTSRIATRTGRDIRPWLGVAATIAFNLASAAGRQKGKVQASMRDRAVTAGDQLAETGLRLLRRVERISGETKRLYPRVRKLIA